jgi:hypothetical protein
MKLFLFVAILFSSFLPSENSEVKIAWSEIDKLTWDDFRGTPSGPKGYVASTNSGISFSYSYGERNGEIKLEYTIQSNFYPDLSWYRPEIVNDYILKHEQAHFDISELFARKLRKRVAAIIPTKNIKKKIDSVYNANESERQEMQHVFDSESVHSRNEVEELKWQQFIAAQLKKYEHWK